MSVDIIIPAAGECVYRAAALTYVSRRWMDLGFDVKIGEMWGPWCKALAVADALERSTADVIVIHDSDSWCPDTPAAVEAVQAGSAWACPFAMVKRLRANVTEDVLAGAPLSGLPTMPPHRAVPGGGVVVITRDLYDRVPLDPRFVLWGFEDIAWGMALRATVGPAQCFTGDLWHLFHPPASKDQSPEKRVASALRARYAKAMRNADDMRQIISEAREALAA
ncbi:hypothetical protein [Gemmatimonas sp.]|uniref:hypothetical protein n=1 Tax=Gemmatimonas sp. TaxID=1962908 RepID=UPI0035657364